MDNLEQKIMDSFRRKAVLLLEETVNYVYSDLTASERSLLITHLKTCKKQEIDSVAEIMSNGGSYMTAKWLMASEMLKSRLVEDDETHTDVSLN